MEKQRLKTIYIAGPVSGLPKDQAYTNFRAAEVLLHQKFWCNTINPMRICKEEWGWWRCMIVCLWHLVTKADMVYFLSGWENSRGANIEHKWAKALGKEVMYGV